jgi:hypothetical protein
MTLGHSYGFRANDITHRTAQAAAFGKRLIHLGPPLVLDGAAIICIFMQILGVTHTGDLIVYEKIKGLSRHSSRRTIWVALGVSRAIV